MHVYISPYYNAGILEMAADGRRPSVVSTPAVLQNGDSYASIRRDSIKSKRSLRQGDILSRAMEVPLIIKENVSDVSKLGSPEKTTGELKNPNIRSEAVVDVNVNTNGLKKDGITVKLHSPSEISNANRLQFAVVAKVFDKDIPFHVTATELRQAVDSVLTGGPWYVNCHVNGLDKWSPTFSPSSMKGLTSPIWVRMPQLPLQCWDEVNIARIASMVGKPLMFDGNMF
ncbi:hypothetical protein M5K25_000457 [Dendrobium thyrsiflorum]|uniref:DUF4283 domain-containing protein n=1 Tax=Dendrobium thyrsiflorum TaxID=117978 RepID=A0ABD0VVD4_DENTH